MCEEITNPVTGRIRFVGCSGAFDRLHDGHKAIIRKAFDSGDRVGIIIFTMPNSIENLQPLETRLATLKSFIESINAYDRAEYWFADTDDDLDKRWSDMEIAKLWLDPELQGWVSCSKDIDQLTSIFPSVLKRREELGIYSNPSPLVLIEPITDANGLPVSSSRQRQMHHEI